MYVTIWLPSRIDNFEFGRAVLAVVPLSGDLEHVGQAAEITLLTIAEADEIICGVVNLSIDALCAIKETLNIQRS